MANQIIEIAKVRRERKYITPDDVSDALKDRRFTTTDIRYLLLEIMGKQTDYGVVEEAECAFLVWQGKI